MWIKLSLYNVKSKWRIYLVEVRRAETYFICLNTFTHIFVLLNKDIEDEMTVISVIRSMKENKLHKSNLKSAQLIHSTYSLKSYRISHLVTVVKPSVVFVYDLSCSSIHNVISSLAYRVKTLWKFIFKTFTALWFTAQVYMSRCLHQRCIKQD